MGEKSAATIGPTPRSFSAAITASPTGPQPTTSGASLLASCAFTTACKPTAIGSVSAACSVGEAVRHRQEQRVVQQHALAVAAREVVRVADRRRALAAHERRHRDDARARLPGAAACPGRSRAPRRRTRDPSRCRARGPSRTAAPGLERVRDHQLRVLQARAGPSRRCRRRGCPRAPRRPPARAPESGRPPASGLASRRLAFPDLLTPKKSLAGVIHRDTVAHMVESDDRERRRRQRKERVLHTRISDDLDDALQDAARRLRVPVSNLVRNVLEDVFDVVEAVTENVGGFVEDVVEEAQDLGRRWEGRFRERTAEARARRAEVERDEPAPPPPRPPAPEPAARSRVSRRRRVAAARDEHRARLRRLRAVDASRRQRLSRGRGNPAGSDVPLRGVLGRPRLAPHLAARRGGTLTP